MSVTGVSVPPPPNPKLGSPTPSWGPQPLVSPKWIGMENSSRRGSLNRKWPKKLSLIKAKKLFLSLYQSPIASVASPNILGIVKQLKLHRVVVRWPVTGDMSHMTWYTWQIPHNIWHMTDFVLQPPKSGLNTVRLEQVQTHYFSKQARPLANSGPHLLWFLKPKVWHAVKSLQGLSDKFAHKRSLM